MNEMWGEWLSHCYPQGGLSPAQLDQLKMAFYSGALSMFSAISKVSELPEDIAVQATENLYQEIIKWGIQRIAAEQRTKN